MVTLQRNRDAETMKRIAFGNNNFIFLFCLNRNCIISFSPPVATNIGLSSVYGYSFFISCACWAKLALM